MERKIEKVYVDKTFGFPIHLVDAPMRKTSAGWVLDFEPTLLEKLVLVALAHKPVALSGNEIRFIRLYFGMTLQAFGERFDVSHAAVIKWEKMNGKPTQMNWATEKDIRLHILSQLKVDKEEVADTYKQLEKKAVQSSKYKPVEVPISQMSF